MQDRELKKRFIQIAGVFFIIALINLNILIEIIGMILFIFVITIGAAFTIEAVAEILKKK